MNSPLRCPFSVDLGAYVLQLLEPAQARRVDEHVAACPDCLAEVSELAGLVPVLSVTDPRPDLAALAAAADAGDSVGAGPRPAGSGRAPGRSHRRWWVPVGAAAAAVVALVIGVLALTGTGAGRSDTSALVRTFPSSGAETVTVRVTGDQVRIECYGYYAQPTGDQDAVEWFALWVRPVSGDPVKVTAWPATPGRASYPGTLDVPLDQVAAFELRNGSGSVVLSTVAR